MKQKHILIVLALTLGFILPAFSDDCSNENKGSYYEHR